MVSLLITWWLRMLIVFVACITLSNFWKISCFLVEFAIIKFMTCWIAERVVNYKDTKSLQIDGNKMMICTGNTHTSDSFVGENSTTKLVHGAAAYIKCCMGWGLDDALLFCGSGTTAAIKHFQEVMGIAVPSTMNERVVKSLRNEERWVVFLGPYELHSKLPLMAWEPSKGGRDGHQWRGLSGPQHENFGLSTSSSPNQPISTRFQ